MRWIGGLPLECDLGNSEKVEGRNRGDFEMAPLWSASQALKASHQTDCLAKVHCPFSCFVLRVDVCCDADRAARVVQGGARSVLGIKEIERLTGAISRMIQPEDMSSVE